VTIDISALRSALRLVSEVVYLNAGTAGPIPSASLHAAGEELASECEEGRLEEHFLRRADLQERLRWGFARVVGAAESDVSLTPSTRDGLARIVDGLRLGRGSEVVTSDEEHPALQIPLHRARARGARIRVVPLREVAEAVKATTTLVACSHVSWCTGEVAPEELAAVEPPVILDGAQAAGAIRVDVHALRCAAYVAPGQKWLCGSEGSGMSYVHPDLRERLDPIGLPPAGIAPPTASRGDARVHDCGALSRATAAATLAALKLLETTGLAEMQERAVLGAATLAARLRESGARVAPRGGSTLIAWHEDDPLGRCKELQARGIVVRPIPGDSRVRASVGAWNVEEDLDRLIAVLRESRCSTGDD
jgi:selenocysteine lyase/cysteine desulfurase